MAKRPYSTQRSAAGVIKNETVLSANTHTRIGGWMEDENDSAIKDWDPSAAYASGITVNFFGINATTVQSTVAGQSPLTHKTKWDWGLITDAAQIALGNLKAVSGNALQQALSSLPGGDAEVQPNATETQVGVTRFGTPDEVNEGIRPDLAVSIKNLYDFFQDFFEDFGGTDLAATLQAGRTGKGSIDLQSTSTPEEGGPAGLNLLDENGNLKFSTKLDETGLPVQVLPSGDKMVYDSGYFQAQVDMFYMSEKASAAELTLRQMDEVLTAQHFIVSSFDNITGGEKLNMVTLAQARTILGSLIDELTDLIVNNIRYKSSEPVVGNDYQDVVQQVMADGLFKHRTISKSQRAKDVLDNTPDIDIYNKIKRFLSGGTIADPGLPDANSIVCITKPAPTLNLESVIVNSLTTTVPVLHSLNTPSNNIIVQEVYTYETATSRWRRNDELEEYISFPDNNHFVVSNDVPGYTGTKIMVKLERISKV